jgi:hypothetical protein
VGIVAEAAVEQMAATLATRYPNRPAAELRADARQQAEDLKAAGWHITAPAAALAAHRARKGAAT